MREPACLATVSFWMPPRICPISPRKALNTSSSSASLRRVSTSLVAAMRIVSLPLMWALSSSPKVCVSLPSRKTLSGLISSPTCRALTFLARRWVSITSWLAEAISRAEALVCSLRAMTCSVRSSSRAFCSLILRALSPRSTSVFSISSSCWVFLSVFSQVWISACSCGCTLSGEGGTMASPRTPPLLSLVRSPANSACEARSCLNAAASPWIARLEALARRCESMRSSPAEAT